jgi:hypothetical protein
MYGVGARLDHAPELLFTLRRASVDELLASAVTELPAAPSAARVLAADGLASLFGIELAEGPAPKAGKPTATAARAATPKPAQRATPKPAQRATPKPAQRATPKPAQRAAPAVRGGGKPASRATAVRAARSASPRIATAPRAIAQGAARPATRKPKPGRRPTQRAARR